MEYLEAAVAQLSNMGKSGQTLNSQNETTCCIIPTRLNKIELRIVSSAFGEELEKIWDWCDVLVLPTLSDNFGLVVAEALERGKRVITTDGAPAWGDGNDYGGRLIYLKGYRDGTTETRLKLLVDGISQFVQM